MSHNRSTAQQSKLQQQQWFIDDLMPSNGKLIKKMWYTFQWTIQSIIIHGLVDCPSTLDYIIRIITVWKLLNPLIYIDWHFILLKVWLLDTFLFSVVVQALRLFSLLYALHSLQSSSSFIFSNILQAWHIDHLNGNKILPVSLQMRLTR